MGNSMLAREVVKEERLCETAEEGFVFKERQPSC